MKKPQFKLHGYERRQVKKELSLLKRDLKYFWHDFDVSVKMASIYDHCEPPDEDAMGKIYADIECEIERLETMLKEPAVIYSAWDYVRLRDRTDIYRVYTYNGKFIFVGINSDTVTDERRDDVVEVMRPDEPCVHTVS